MARRQDLGVLGYFYVLVSIMAVATVVLAGSVFLNAASESDTQAQSYELHIRTLTLTGEASDAAARLLEQYADELPPLPEDRRFLGRRKIDSALHFLGESLYSIAYLQEQRGLPEHAGAVARLLELYERIYEAQKEERWPAAAFRKELATLGRMIYKLERLHSVSVEDDLRAMERAERRHMLNLGFGTALVALLTGAIVVRLLRLLSEHLEQRRRDELALLESERQLQQTKKMEALGTLVGGVAHDFNNILTVILGNAEAALADDSSVHSRGQFLREIQAAGDRAANMTQRLLSFSRREDVQPEVVDLGELLRSMEALLRRLIRADIELLIDVDGRPGHILIDPVQLEQLIINLVVNARDALPRGGRITIRAAALEIGGQADGSRVPPGRYTWLQIEDTGFGMSPETRARVFDPFFTTKEPGQGTGLGLFGAHALVTKSGGHIFSESELDKGTRFDIYIPSCDAEQPEPAVPAPHPARQDSGVVLVAEDEPQVRELAAAALRRLGYEVLVAENGVEGLELFREHAGRVDLVLTDIIMPHVGGPELVRDVLALDPEVGVVFMSGYTEDSIVREVLDSNRRFLHKPFQLTDLLEAVQAELDRVRGDRAGAAASNA